MSSGLST